MSPRWIVAAAVFALAACAAPEGKRADYNRMVGGTQVISISAHTVRWESSAPPFYQVPAKQVFSKVEGGTCTLKNDKGEWVAPLPGEVAVTTGGALDIECRAQGYKPGRSTLACSDPRSRGALGGAFAPLALSPQLTALGIVAAPAAVVGVMVMGAVVGSEMSVAAAGPEARDACDYSRTAVGIYLWPDEQIEEPW